MVSSVGAAQPRKVAADPDAQGTIGCGDGQGCGGELKMSTKVSFLKTS